MKKLIVICILSIIAFINASYLTYESFRIDKLNNENEITTNDKTKNQAFCDINETFSCSNVLKNPIAKIGGIIPFPLIAMIVYPIIFVVALLGIKKIISNVFHILGGLAFGGILFNGWFIYQEFVYIKSFCVLCLTCSVIILTIFILSMIGIKSIKLNNDK